MRTLFTYMISLLLLGANAQGTLFHHNKTQNRAQPNTFNPQLAPFYHGVASGDPLSDRVIIWTRVTPETMDNQEVEVEYRVGTDPLVENIIADGMVTTGPEQDYTVKIDVTGLEAGQTYYYVFKAFGNYSLIGKTKTTPTDDMAMQLKFGVVSCANYQAGYFNAYWHLAQRTDLDAIIHLGDYIYEYADGVYGDTNIMKVRPLEPINELVTLEEYRTRYSTYRLDSGLMRAHQQHPFVVVWDDHESANDAWTDGAENHDEETEGPWEVRKEVAKQAYFEWLPIRDTENRSVYRKISYGNLMDLIMLDTRLEGREEQILDITNPALYDPARTLLGQEQKNWLLNELSNSTAKWKVIGQQVIFSEFNAGWGALVDQTQTFEEIESTFLDIWDGYPAERQFIYDYVLNNNIENLVFLTGDFHCAFAFDATPQPVDLQFIDVPDVGTLPFYFQSPTYDSASGAGAVMPEFATPSITSANFDENTDAFIAAVLQAQINQPINPGIPGVSLGNPNPHMKYVDLIRNGYFVLDIQDAQAQADFYFTEILEVTDQEVYETGFLNTDDTRHIQPADAEASPKAVQDIPAPANPPMYSSVNELENSGLAILGVYPNPVRDLNTLHFSLTRPADVQVKLIDMNGATVKSIRHEQLMPGIFSLKIDVSDLANGTYFYQIESDGQIYTAKLLVNR